MSVLDGLRSAEAATRLAAIDELRTRGTGSAEEIVALTVCLGDDRKAVQRRAAEAFVAIAGDGGVATLQTLLGAPGLRQRWGAAYALAQCGEVPAEALPVLVETLGSGDGDLRWAAADLLIRMRPRGPVVEVLHALARAGVPPARKMALYCLRDIGVHSPEVERTMDEALADADSGVRLAALSALSRVGAGRLEVAERLLPLLDDHDPGVRRAAAATLGRMGVASAPIVSALRVAAGDADEPLRRAAADALTRLGAT